jgi:uncharacterized metal-binding protein
MPNFKRHQQTCYEWLILLLTIYSAIITKDFVIPLYTIGFIVGTNYITPDLDTGSTPYNKHKWLWFIYKKSSKHRGMSHNILLGVMIKIIYLIILLIPLIYVFGLFLDDNILLWKTLERTIELSKIYYVYIISFVIGMSTSNGIHIIQDKLN